MSLVSKIVHICKVGGKLMKEMFVIKKYNNGKFAKKIVHFPVPISSNGYCSILVSDTEVDILL